MPLRLCVVLLNADWPLGVLPPTPKWTLGATQKGHKHKQMMAGLV